MYNIEQLKRQCKDLLRDCKRGQEEAWNFLRTHHPAPPEDQPRLSHLQFAVARSRGFKSWPHLKFQVCGAQLLELTKTGDIAKMERLLETYPRAVEYAQEERTALHFATMAGSLEMVKLLLAKGADAQKGFYPDRLHTTPLELARERGFAALIQFLEDLPTSTHCSLEAACRKGEVKVVEEFLHQAWDLEDLESGKKATFAFQSDTTASSAILELLVTAGAQMDLRTAALLGRLDQVRSLAPTREDKEDALIWAARAGRTRLVAWLLEQNINPDAPRDFFSGWEPEAYRQLGLPLWNAAAHGHAEVVNLLLAGGASLDAMIYAGGTPVMVASQYGHPEVVALLCRAGATAPLNFEHDSLETIEAGLPHQMWLLTDDFALPLACKANREEVVEYMLSLLEDRPTGFWEPSLRYTLRGGSLSILEQLRSRGADLLAVTARGETLLHELATIWCQQNPRRAQLATYLVDQGVDINAVAEEKETTALGYASQNGDLELASTLLELGADRKLAGAPWAVPEELARKRGHSTLVELLR